MPLLPSETKKVWVVEFAPTPASTVGGWDWFLDYGKALEHFQKEVKEQLREDTHDVAIYSITVPEKWGKDKIQVWLEDNGNIIPQVDEVCAD